MIQHRKSDHEHLSIASVRRLPLNPCKAGSVHFNQVLHRRPLILHDVAEILLTDGLSVLTVCALACLSFYEVTHMVGSSLKLMLAGAAMLVFATGCTNLIPGPATPEHIFNRCAPASKPCPRECPDFPLPPGGPYLVTPGIHAPLNPAVAPGGSGMSGGGEISVKQK
jgi:hypothetical protein